MNTSTIAIIQPVQDLVSLASLANAEHEAGEGDIRRGLEHYRRAGLALIEAKKLCKHGEWLPWLKANVKFSQPHASRYMRLAKLITVINLAEQWRIITGREDSDEDEPNEDEPEQSEPQQPSGDTTSTEPAQPVQNAQPAGSSDSNSEPEPPATNGKAGEWQDCDLPKLKAQLGYWNNRAKFNPWSKSIAENL